MKDLLMQMARRSIAAKRLMRWYYTKWGDFPHWNRTLSVDRADWEGTVQAAKNGPAILIATSVGSYQPAIVLEGMLASALTQRGANVHFLLCDGRLPACSACTIRFYPSEKQFVAHGPSRDLCASCFKNADSIYRSFGLPVHRYSELISPEDQQKAEEISSALPLADIGSYAVDDMAVGEHVLAGALRYYARGTLGAEQHAEVVLRRYLKSSLLTLFAVRRLVRATPFECAVFHHGIYVPQGLIGEVARRERIRVVNWNPAYRKKSFIFSHGDTYHHTLMSEPVSTWENISWNSLIETKLMDYLRSRWYGTNDWITFQERPEEDPERIARRLGLDSSRPCIGMLTNVVWDAQLHYPANAFPGMLEWAIQTIAYFAKRSDLQLLIRVHPAEIKAEIPTRQPIMAEIRRAFPSLPHNVFIIPPESNISTYAAMMGCNAAIIYGTKTGVELTSMGIPVIVAGEAWIRNKGITRDASSAADYFSILDELPFAERLDSATVQRARKYAYHFFFRRMIPLKAVEPVCRRSPYKLALSSVTDLLPGRDRGLDVICDGILKGSDFVYLAENYGSS